MPLLLTVWIAKLVAIASRSLGRGGGSALPGLVAERLDKNVLAKLRRNLGDVILVTGTNGKTTTVKMLAAILEAEGKQLVVNQSGSNMSRGIISALIAGNNKDKTGVFEVDEAALRTVSAALQPKTILVLNLFRDQLDRYGELNTTAKLIGEGIAKTNAKVILNADDPLVAGLNQYAKGEVVYFGVEDKGYERMKYDYTADSGHCPKCGEALDYKHAYFSHLGVYSCPEGHFTRPKPAYQITKVVDDQKGQYALNADGTKADMNIQLPGLYNAYNAMAALATAASLDADHHRSLEALQSVSAAFGRVEEVRVGNKKIYLLLIKNPTGFNQIIQTFLTKQKNQPVLIAINDNFADGRDVSWLWDAGLEAICEQRHNIIVSGVRAGDMALRLKYAGIPSQVKGNLVAALDELLANTPDGGTALILPTYTTMLQLRNILKLDTRLREVRR